MQEKENNCKKNFDLQCLLEKILQQNIKSFSFEHRTEKKQQQSSRPATCLHANGDPIDCLMLQIPHTYHWSDTKHHYGELELPKTKVLIMVHLFAYTKTKSSQNVAYIIPCNVYKHYN